MTRSCPVSCQEMAANVPDGITWEGAGAPAGVQPLCGGGVCAERVPSGAASERAARGAPVAAPGHPGSCWRLQPRRAGQPWQARHHLPVGCPPKRLVLHTCAEVSASSWQPITSCMHSTACQDRSHARSHACILCPNGVANILSPSMRVSRTQPGSSLSEQAGKVRMW